MKTLIRSPTRTITPFPCGAYGCTLLVSMLMMRSVFFNSFASFAAAIAPMKPTSSARVSRTAIVDLGGLRRSISTAVRAEAQPARSSQAAL